MAKLPTQKRVFIADLRNAPEWAHRLVDSINTFMQSVSEALAGRLKVAENVALDFVDVEVNGTSPLVKFESRLGRPLQGLLVVQLLEGVPVAAISVAQWVEVNSTITVSIQGLSAGVAYKLRLLIV